MPPRLAIDYSKETESNLFGISKSAQNALSHWNNFVVAKNISPPFVVEQLSKFCDHLLDAKSPSVLTMLSSIHCALISQGRMAAGEGPAYKLLFRRAKAALVKLQLLPHQADIITTADVGDLGDQDLALTCTLCQLGRRADNVIGGAKSSSAPLKPATVSLDKDLRMSVKMRKDKKDRLGGVIIGCSCGEGPSGDFCIQHRMSRRAEIEFPLSWARLDDLLAKIPGGATAHSFRRTAAVSLRRHMGTDWCVAHLEEVNKWFGWSLKSGEFWRYSEGFEYYPAEALFLPNDTLRSG
jgi:hypothetical protein